MPFSKSPPSRLTRYLSIAEIANVLSVSERTVRRWIQAGDLKAHQLGRHWRIHPDDLAAFLAARGNARTCDVR